MNIIKVGDFVKGLPNDLYSFTNENMTKGLVLAVNGDYINLKILEHKENKTGRFDVKAKHFEVIGRQKEFNREEILALIKKGAVQEVLNYNLSGADLSGANLRGADLSGADLRRADLRGAYLRGAYLRDANLSGANLSGANLRGADLRRADLSGADLRRADLKHADLKRANLSGADLRDADLDYSCYPLWCGSLDVKTGEDIRLSAQLAYHLCSIKCDDEEYIRMRNSIIDFANKFHRVGECGKLEKLEIKGEQEVVK